MQRSIHVTYFSLVAQMLKNLPAMQETQVQSLGREDALEKGMATHSSLLAWRIPWTQEPGEIQSMGLQRVGQSYVTNTFTFHFSDKEKPLMCSQQRQDANRLPYWTYPGSTWWLHCGRAELPLVLPHITVRNDGAAFPEKKPGMKKYTFIFNESISSTGRRIFL